MEFLIKNLKILVLLKKLMKCALLISFKSQNDSKLYRNDEILQILSDIENENNILNTFLSVVTDVSRKCVPAYLPKLHNSILLNSM